MELLRWMGLMFARFVAVSVIILSGWLIVANLSDRGYELWVLAWIFASGIAGTVGGVFFMLSLDGPMRFRTRGYRTGSWIAMLAAVILPTSLTYMLVPLVLVLAVSLFTIERPREKPEEAVTSG